MILRHCQRDLRVQNKDQISEGFEGISTNRYLSSVCDSSILHLHRTFTIVSTQKGQKAESFRALSIGHHFDIIDWTEDLHRTNTHLPEIVFLF